MEISSRSDLSQSIIFLDRDIPYMKSFFSPQLLILNRSPHKFVPPALHSVSSALSLPYIQKKNGWSNSVQARLAALAS
jgi:hypothetical protein